MIYDRFSLTFEVSQQLELLEEARAKLDPYARLPEEYTVQLRRHVLAEAIHYSTRIEGNTLTLSQVESLLAGQVVSAPADQIQEVQNYKEALAYIQTLNASEAGHLTEQTVKTIHYLVTKSLPGAYAPGAYRTEQNYVVDRVSQRRLFLPPAQQEVPRLMEDFIAWLNGIGAEFPAPIRAGLAHLNLVAIHPFMDGNGRTARVMESLVLYADGFRNQELASLESYYGRDTRRYYSALAEALGTHYGPPRDVTPWVEYYLTAHVEQAGAAITEIEQTIAVLDGLDAAFAAQGLSIDKQVVLLQAFVQGKVTNNEYRAWSGKSRQMIVNDFNDLIERGLVHKVGRGRAVGYVLSQDTHDLIRRVREESLKQ